MRDHGKAGKEGPGESRVKGVFRQRGSLERAGKVKVPVGVMKGGEGHRGGTHTVQGGVALHLAFNLVVKL